MTPWGSFVWGHSYWGGTGLLSPVYDRTATDVQNKTAKGYYNTSDLNRVETNIRYLVDRLNSLGFNLNLTIKTDWANDDIPTQSDMERYRANIAAIRAAFIALGTTPNVPASMRFLGFQGANDLEKIQMDVSELTVKTPSARRHSGAVACGQGGLML